MEKKQEKPRNYKILPTIILLLEMYDKCIQKHEKNQTRKAFY